MVSTVPLASERASIRDEILALSPSGAEVELADVRWDGLRPADGDGRTLVFLSFKNPAPGLETWDVEDVNHLLARVREVLDKHDLADEVTVVLEASDVDEDDG